MTYDIRRATPADNAETAAVFSAALKGMAFLPKLHTDAEDSAFVGRFITEQETWLAVDDGRIVGIACLEDDRLAHLYVDPEYRNRGAGSALLSHVKTRRPNGFDLWCFHANTGARRFYRRHCCREVEWTKGERNEEKLPDVRFVWQPLSDDAANRS